MLPCVFSVALYSILGLPGCRGHRCVGQCFLKHSAHSCRLRKREGAPDVARGRDDRPVHTKYTETRTQSKKKKSVGSATVKVCILPIYYG